MDFKYIPVLKNRAAETEALVNQKVSNSVLPLIEIAIERPNGKKSEDFVSSHEMVFKRLEKSIIVDIPMYLKLSKKDTNDLVYSFLNPIYEDPIKRVNYLESLFEINKRLYEPQIIPSVSYIPDFKFNNGFITLQATSLRNKYKTLAFRLFSDEYCFNALNEIEKVILPEDIILLEIGETHHTQQNNIRIYEKIRNLKLIKLCKSVLIRSAIPKKLKNTELENGKYIDADNSLINFYKTYGFDSFGDYAGIRRSEIDKAYGSSPAYINYYKEGNAYVGFKGIYREPKTFTTMVLPNYSNSIYWSSLSDKHKENCYGCTLIQGMLNGTINPNSAPRWKTISICHYIQSIDELL